MTDRQFNCGRLPGSLCGENQKELLAANDKDGLNSLAPNPIRKQRTAASQIRYVTRVGKDNWLLVRLVGVPSIIKPNGKMEIRTVSLPFGLKVRVSEVKDGYEYFEILEGVNKGKQACVTLKGSGQSYLTNEMNIEGPGKIRFNLDMQALWYGSEGPIQAFSGSFSTAFNTYAPVARGTYDLQIPGYPSKQTRPEYAAYTPFHNTWFRIGLNNSGSRFLHCGEISEGCVTVRAFQFDSGKTSASGFTDLPGLPPGALGMPYPAMPKVGSWTDVYNYLICRRANDQSVGTLIVT